MQDAFMKAFQHLAGFEGGSRSGAGLTALICAVKPVTACYAW